MKQTTTGEATPPQNTAPKLDPATFDEAALTAALEKTLGAAAEETKEPNPPADPPTEVDSEPGAPEQPGEADDPSAEPQEGAEEANSEETDSRGVQKRIDKLTAQKKEAIERAESAERELEQTKARLQELESAPPATGPAASQFSDIWDDNKLTGEWEKARAVKRWCEDHPDGAEAGGREYTADEVREIRRRAEDALDIGIPQRARFLQQHRQVKPLAEQVYPFWKDRNSQEYGEAQVILRQMPALAMLPEYPLFIGDFLAGRAARLAKQKEQAAAKVAPKLPPKVAPRQPTAPKAAVRLDEGKAKFDAAKKRFLKTGSTEELARLLETS